MLEQRYDELVGDIDGIVWEADAETLQFTFVSPKAERWLGYPLEQWFARGFWAAHLHPDDRDRVFEHCRQVADSRRGSLSFARSEPVAGGSEPVRGFRGRFEGEA